MFDGFIYFYHNLIVSLDGFLAGQRRYFNAKRSLATDLFTPGFFEPNPPETRGNREALIAHETSFLRHSELRALYDEFRTTLQAAGYYIRDIKDFEIKMSGKMCGGPRELTPEEEAKFYPDNAFDEWTASMEAIHERVRQLLQQVA